MGRPGTAGVYMFEWADKIGSRGRCPWLLLVDRDGVVREFTGESMPGIVAVIGTDYEKAGKWSHTTYRMELATGVRAIAGRDGWETGRFVEGLAAAVGYPGHIDRWVDVANALGTTIPETMRFLREWRPKAAEALDAVEEAITEVDDTAEQGAETIAISFGSPTRRQRNDGFWEWPVVVTLDGQEVGRIVPGEDGRWTSSGQVNILSMEHSSGHGGGYVSMRLAVPAGGKAHHGS